MLGFGGFRSLEFKGPGSGIGIRVEALKGLEVYSIGLRAETQFGYWWWFRV